MFYLDNSKVHGKGVFCEDVILADEDFECPILILEDEDIKILGITSLSNKLFKWGEYYTGMVLSPLCMANHSKEPNMKYEPSISRGEETIKFTALRNIPARTEILIDYQDFAKVLGLD